MINSKIIFWCALFKSISHYHNQNLFLVDCQSCVVISSTTLLLSISICRKERLEFFNLIFTKRIGKYDEIYRF